MSKNNKKNKTFQTLAKTLFSNKLSEVSMPTDRVDYRHLSKEDLKKYMTEAFKDAKDACEVEAEEGFWGDAEIENELNWVKTLKLKEYFGKDSGAEKEDSKEDKEEEKEDAEDKE